MKRSFFRIFFVVVLDVMHVRSARRPGRCAAPGTSRAHPLSLGFAPRTMIHRIQYTHSRRRIRSSTRTESRA
jgi:hypothetical protein